MAKSFDTLKAKMPKSALIKAGKLIEKMMLDMPLQELRQARSLSQER